MSHTYTSTIFYLILISGETLHRSTSMKVRNCKGKILIADSLDYKFIYGEKKIFKSPINLI